jgi:hypothetical protein
MPEKQSISTAAFVSVAHRHNHGILILRPYLCLGDKMWPENGGQGLVHLAALVC